ncbi:MAG TPA: BACON domain-containing carbohydrate-binding protein, partial [Opitutaceae bacterium]|nr:BACON domain-containing carbohydrate-binding protein [Opitutaceae bacterium]
MPASEEADWEGTSYQLAVDSDTTWTVSTSDSWISASATDGSGKADLIVTVAPNPTDFDRSATITIDGQTHTLTQHARVIVSSSGSTTVSQKTPAKAEPTLAPLSDLLLPAAVPAAVFPGYGNTYRMDTSFATLLEADGGSVSAVAASADGGFFVGGNFSTIGGQTHLGLAKFKSDGTADPAFNSNGGFDGAISSIAVQTNGQIVVTGSFKTFNGTARAGIARLNADGTLDSIFNPGTGVDGGLQPFHPGYLYALAAQSDGRILIGGAFADFNGTPCQPLVRLNADGTPDPNFNPGSGFDNGTYPLSVNALAVQPDGRILAGGSFVAYNGTARAGIVRLNADGSLDPSFNPGTGISDGNQAPYPGLVSGITVQANGQILIEGVFTAYNGTARAGFARLNADGSLDTGFNPASAFNGTIVPLAVQTDGRIFVGGSFTTYNGVAYPGIARLNTDGTLDPSFNPGTGFGNGSNPSSVGLAVQTDGRIVAAGQFTTYNGTSVANLARLTTTGALDSTLSAGSLRTPGLATATALSDGKIMVGGPFTRVNGIVRNGIVRLNTDGTVDSSFDPGTGFNNGSNSFNIGNIIIQSNGQILVSGSFTSFNGATRAGLARLNADGTLDPSFSVSSAGALEAGQPDGKTFLSIWAGLGRWGNPQLNLVRLNADGTSDPTFKFVFTYYSIDAVDVQSDGRILVAGSYFSDGMGEVFSRFLRLKSDGTEDVIFWDVGSDRVTCLGLQNDGRI